MGALGLRSAASISRRTDKRVDPVVISTHWRDGFALLLGSVAMLVPRQSSCPVLAVRHGLRQKHPRLSGFPSPQF
jgi:nucleotide-binding universal stress UspA family protein